MDENQIDTDVPELDQDGEQGGCIRIFRFKTGEDVIAYSPDYYEDDNVVTLVEPMIIKNTKVRGAWQMMIYPWLPIDIIEFNEATIDIGDVTTILVPTEKFVAEYKDAVDHFLSVLTDTERPMEQLYNILLENFNSPDAKH